MLPSNRSLYPGFGRSLQNASSGISRVYGIPVRGDEGAEDEGVFVDVVFFALLRYMDVPDDSSSSSSSSSEEG